MSAPSFPDLPRVQQLFWRLIVAPEGVAKGAADLRDEGLLEATDLSFLVRPDDRMDATERLDVYADMYFYRLRDCLAEDFPALKAWIGDARFHNLVTDYLLAHPPSHFSLRELGRALPGSLAVHALEREYPTLADLAALEWARVDVFDETDAPVLDREGLLARASAAADSFAMRLAPAARLVPLAPSVLPRWKALDAGEPAAAAFAASPDRGASVTALVWRREFAVCHRSLAADEALCLGALAAGPVTLAGVGARLAEAGGADAAPERLAALLEDWTREGILTAD